MNDGAKWHWGEGVKYAHELLKSLLIINGAAAISMLTFIGNVRLLNGYLVFGMFVFGLGVVASVLAMLFAYLSQLHYGNAEMEPRATAWPRATKFHFVTYAVGILALAAFAAGMAFAGWGLMLQSLPQAS